jgi:AmmeMemoRadiSam system protein A
MLPLSPDDGQKLAGLAAAVVSARLSARPVRGWPPPSPPLRARGATFVTLEATGALRGCIGTLEASRPLYVDVIRNTVRAMADPRLPPVVSTEWPVLDICVSVLSAPAPVDAFGRAELLAVLQAGTDGLILTDGVRRATFLPTVWRKLPDPEEFVAALLAKGGWPADGWPPGLRPLRYTATEFHDRSPRSPLPGAG